MPIFYTASDTFDAQVHKEEVCHGIDNFGSIDGRIVILNARSAKTRCCNGDIAGDTSSHQLMVDVCGNQNPSLVMG